MGPYSMQQALTETVSTAYTIHFCVRFTSHPLPQSYITTSHHTSGAMSACSVCYSRFLLAMCTLLSSLFPHGPKMQHNFSTRHQARYHTHKTHERCSGTHTEQLSCSLFGLVYSFNILDSSHFTHKTTSAFQTSLTELSR